MDRERATERNETNSVRISFNHVDPFTHSMVLYVLAFLTRLRFVVGMEPVYSIAPRFIFYCSHSPFTRSASFHGCICRNGRPSPISIRPRSSSAGALSLSSLFLERIFRNGIGAVCAGAIGFVTLLIAHHLAGSGDTLEMLHAVLDTNFWLATHVVAITHRLRRHVSRRLARDHLHLARRVHPFAERSETADSLARMVYGIVCFATLFSFVGTVLGGIWADQSWGRFWGWDPKENGALIIVLWSAIILHARWGGS